MTTELTITRPDDWHLHLRDGALLKDTVPSAARYFGRSIVMPNLAPPVVDAPQAQAYRQRILDQRPANSQWQPLMVIYLTDNTSAEMIRVAKESKVIAAKLYPASATTNSASGVTAMKNIFPALQAMSETGMPLLVHGEVTHSEIDIFDREKQVIDQHLVAIVERFPDLKVVLEHVTTEDAVQFVSEAGKKVVATITPQHLMYNRNDLLVGGIKLHFYCLPILKRNIHQLALRDVVASGNSKFFLGTDSAPHEKLNKESSCGCAGCFPSHAPLEMYAEVFEELGVLDKLEAFASFHGPEFYGLPRNSDSITLRKANWQVPSSYPLAGGSVIPLKAGESISWQVVN